MLLKEFLSDLNNPKVMKFFCNFVAMEILTNARHASFFLYYFLSQVAIEENLMSTTIVALLERLEEYAVEK